MVGQDSTPIERSGPNGRKERPQIRARQSINKDLHQWGRGSVKLKVLVQFWVRGLEGLHGASSPAEFLIRFAVKILLEHPSASMISGQEDHLFTIPLLITLWYGCQGID